MANPEPNTVMNVLIWAITIKEYVTERLAMSDSACIYQSIYSSEHKNDIDFLGV